MKDPILVGLLKVKRGKKALRFTASARPPVYGTVPTEHSKTELASEHICPKYDFSSFVHLFFLMVPL